MSFWVGQLGLQSQLFTNAFPTENQQKANKA